MSTLRLNVHMNRPLSRPVRRHVIPKAVIDPQEGTGKFLGLFVLFASTMNWLTYRRIRKSKD